MKKNILRIQFPIVLASILFSRGIGAVDVKIAFDDNLYAGQEGKIAELARQSWSHLEKTFQVKKEITLPLKIISSQNSGNQWARTEEQGVLISREVPASKFNQILNHEISHFFLIKTCENKVSIRNQIVHETFSQWVNKDYIRLLENNKFLFAKDAHEWFLKNDWDAKKDTRRFEEALARIISVTNHNTLETYFKNLIQNCTTGNFKENEWNQKLAEILNFMPDHAMKTSKVDFVLIDGLSQKVMAEEGNTKQKYPTASTLKPLLVSMYPELITTKKSRAHNSWFCPDESNIRDWNWREALTKSCNGFFLDTEPLPLSKLNQQLTSFGIPSKITSMAGAIGLFPETQLSLKDMAKVYKWIDINSPQVLDELRNTVKEGTLAKLPASDWFYQRGIMLKSGTERDAKSRPRNAWIVATGPRGKNGRASFFAVIHANGTSTKFLLNELKNRLSNVNLQAYEAEVGLFSLIPKNQIEIGCRNHEPMMIGRKPSSKQKLKSGDLVSGQNYFCLGGPLVVTFPGASKRREARSYYGVLEYNEKNQESSNSKFLSEKQVRARTESPFKLHTSLRHYLWGVVAAEFPRGQKEVLKALALVAKNNHDYYKQSGRPICDNTYCQVFGPNQVLAPSYSRKINQAVEETLSSRILINQKTDWVYFSLGGEKPWKKNLKLKTIKSALNESEIQFLKKTDGKVFVNLNKQYSCEVFRNQLKLPSCPESMTQIKDSWIFEGKGEGHSMGLSLTEANSLAAQGKNSEEILKVFLSGVDMVRQ